MSTTFTERRIDVDGASIRCFEAGQGEVVVALHGETDASPTPLENMLSQKFRVVVLESPGFGTRAPHEASRLIARVVRDLGLKNHSMVASTSATAPALWRALEA